MKEINIFDVVELTNGNKATILGNEKDVYKVEIVNKEGKSQEIKYIKASEINKIIFSK